MASHPVEQNLPPQFDEKARALKRKKAIGVIDKQKQTIQQLARELIEYHLKDKPEILGEKARLYEALLGDNPSIYHRPMALEGQLKNTENHRIKICLEQLSRARNILHNPMARHFPPIKPENHDLNWAATSFLVGVLFTPLMFISPYFLLLLPITPLFFVGRKIVHFFSTPPFDFTLDSGGVTPAEYKDAVEAAEQPKQHTPSPPESGPEMPPHLGPHAPPSGAGTPARPGFFKPGIPADPTSGAGPKPKDEHELTL